MLQGIKISFLFCVRTCGCAKYSTFAGLMIGTRCESEIFASQSFVAQGPLETSEVSHKSVAARALIFLLLFLAIHGTSCIGKEARLEAEYKNVSTAL